MPEKKTLERARQDKREGKAPSTQAGEFVREEMDHVREGKHGARSAKQAIAIGLSKARRAGVKLPPPKKGKASERTRTAGRARQCQGIEPIATLLHGKGHAAVSSALKREGHASRVAYRTFAAARASAKKRGASQPQQGCSRKPPAHARGAHNKFRKA